MNNSHPKDQLGWFPCPTFRLLPSSFSWSGLLPSLNGSSPPHPRIGLDGWIVTFLNDSLPPPPSDGWTGLLPGQLSSTSSLSVRQPLVRGKEGCLPVTLPLLPKKRRFGGSGGEPDVKDWLLQQYSQIRVFCCLLHIDFSKFIYITG